MIRKGLWKVGAFVLKLQELQKDVRKMAQAEVQQMPRP